MVMEVLEPLEALEELGSVELEDLLEAALVDTDIQEPTLGTELARASIRTVMAGVRFRLLTDTAISWEDTIEDSTFEGFERIFSRLALLDD